MQANGVTFAMPNGMGGGPQGGMQQGGLQQGPNGELQDSSGNQVPSGQPGMMAPMGHAQMAAGIPHGMQPHPGGMVMNEMSMGGPNGGYGHGPMQPMPMQHYGQPVDGGVQFAMPMGGGPQNGMQPGGLQQGPNGELQDPSGIQVPSGQPGLMPAPPANNF